MNYRNRNFTKKNSLHYLNKKPASGVIIIYYYYYFWPRIWRFFNENCFYSPLFLFTIVCHDPLPLFLFTNDFHVCLRKRAKILIWRRRRRKCSLSCRNGDQMLGKKSNLFEIERVRTWEGKKVELERVRIQI